MHRHVDWATTDLGWTSGYLGPVAPPDPENLRGEVTRLRERIAELERVNYTLNAELRGSRYELAQAREIVFLDPNAGPMRLNLGENSIASLPQSKPFEMMGWIVTGLVTALATALAAWLAS